MRLRTRLFLPLLAAGMAVSGYVYFLLLPGYLDFIARQSRDQLASHLSSISEGLVPLMLENQLATVYDNLDALKAGNPNWHSIRLYDRNNTLVYPLSLESGPARSNLLTLEQPVGYLDSDLGRLVISADINSSLAAARSYTYKFVAVLLLGTFAVLLVMALLIEWLVRRPVNDLVVAADRLAQGDFDANLKIDRRDELGHLTHSFVSMRDSIRRYQQRLSQEIDDHKVTAQALNQEKERVSYHARHDSLTGLVNRREFESRVSAAIDEAHQTTAQHGLLYIDLDQFKVVNDTCGHVAGDELLKQLSQLLNQQVRQVDTLARLGGDEFGVLLEHCPIHQAVNIADELRETIQDYRFAWGDNLFSVGASIGVVAIGADSGDTQTVFRNADAACYAAKDKGRNRIHVYQLEDFEVARRHGEMQWIARINRAIAEDRFELYCQPIVVCGESSARPRHYEVLVRLIDEQGRSIPPGAFIPAAERYNVMIDIDRWVIRNLCRNIANLRRIEPGYADTLWSLNISGSSLSNQDLLSYIAGQITAYDVPPTQLCFEMTETAAIADLADATNFFSSLKKIGCRFSLDDFGSGLSSFGYLKNLPVDFIKIDGVFVKDIVDDPVDCAMVKSINEMGHVLGVKTIAEFVENDAILELLRGIGVDYVQGFGIAKPFPLKELPTRYPVAPADSKVVPLTPKQHS